MRTLSRTSPARGRTIPWTALLVLALAWTDANAADSPPASGAAKAARKATQPSRTVSGSEAIADGLPASLDQALADAMQNHVDIVAAKAKLTLAEAELHRTQIEVARRIISLWSERQAQERAALTTRERHKSGTMTAETLIAAEASLAQTQIELRYLTGRIASPGVRLPGFKISGRSPRMPSGPIAEKVRQALDAPTQMEFTDQPLIDVLTYLADLHRIDLQPDSRAFEGNGLAFDKEKIRITIKGVPLAAALQALEDQHPPLKFVVRDYGILATTSNRAEEEGFYPAVDFADRSEGGKAIRGQ